MERQCEKAHLVLGGQPPSVVVAHELGDVAVQVLTAAVVERPFVRGAQNDSMALVCSSPSTYWPRRRPVERVDVLRREGQGLARECVRIWLPLLQSGEWT